jgi:branched-subunit amino acid ABC-type transport system permease component
MALVATGLSIVFGIQKIVNFAHGALYAFGAYLAFALLQDVLPGSSISYFLAAVILAAVLTGLIGVVMEVIVLRPIYKSEDPITYSILATFGLMIAFREIIILIWGTTSRNIDIPPELAGTIDLGTITYPLYNLFLLAVALGMVLLTWVAIERTQLGSLIRAGTENRPIASAMGVNVDKVNTMTFFLGAALAGFGGALHAPAISMSPFMDIDVIIAAFVVVVIGGLGKVEGALLGGILLGLVRGITSVAYPQLVTMSMFLVLIIVMLYKPEGLAGGGWVEEEEAT